MVLMSAWIREFTYTAVCCLRLCTNTPPKNALAKSFDGGLTSISDSSPKIISPKLQNKGSDDAHCRSTAK